MLRTFVTLALAALALGAAPTPAADLAKVDRALKKEPAYRGKPHYCLLVFGPEAKERAWLVLDLASEPWDTKGDRDALYVDRDGSGDLTRPGMRVPGTMRSGKSFDRFSHREHPWFSPSFAAGAILGREGGLRYTDLVVEVPAMYVGRYRPCQLSVKVNGRPQTAGGPLLRWGDRPEDAPVLHFGGPRTMRLNMETAALHVPVNYDGGEPAPPYYEEEALVRGKTMNLYAQVGTPGRGRGTFAALSAGDVPAGVHPVAEVAFPPAEAGGKPLRAKVVLEGRCCGTRFYGRIHVPEAAGPGKAKVKLSFDAWKEGKVAPATFEVSVVDNEAKVKK
jgi:hypothetical protein